jgi:hypothetical protein
MDRGGEDKGFQDLRFRLDEVSDELKQLRSEWLEAHSRMDIDRETELVHRETELFNQVNDVIKGFAGWLRQSRAA